MHPNEPALPVGHCAHCQREVLTHIDFADDGAEVRRCVHCDRALRVTHHISADEVDALGYAVLEPRGCGTGGGCGRGTCGTRRPS